MTTTQQKSLNTLSGMPSVVLAHCLAMENEFIKSGFTGATFTVVSLPDWLSEKISNSHTNEEDNFLNINEIIAQEIYNDLILIKDVVFLTGQNIVTPTE